MLKPSLAQISGVRKSGGVTLQAGECHRQKSRAERSRCGSAIRVDSFSERKRSSLFSEERIKVFTLPLERKELTCRLATPPTPAEARGREERKRKD
ncbi:hypothetical protein Q8A67_013867 [Cirrhinus molitorella]|uniref:Uncharacterized protein n=1 Tax=Cirrhinus molitorella TaxID=172907 RepID=A0AA88PJ43_9TELE|nr:hypothetical protein Q8A67_013867 [Cirrhinus molitorella]